MVELGVPGVSDPVEIGRGGFGVVYRATETDLNRPVAVKLLTGELDEAARRRFDRERRAMGSLSGHPNIVTVYRSGVTEHGRAYLIMEFLSGGSMAERLRSSGALEWSEAAEVGASLADALEAAHREGVLHRDIKPGNLLVDSRGTVKLGDFGIARMEGAPETKSAVITASIAHAAPEVIAGRRPDARADIYSLASTLFELLNGSPAFIQDTDETLVPMLARIASDPVPPMHHLDAPEAFVAVVERGMAKDPDRRFQTAAEFADALRLAVRGEAPPVEPATTLLGSDPDPSAPGSAPVAPPPPPPPPLDSVQVGAAASGPLASPGQPQYISDTITQPARRRGLSGWVWAVIIGGGLVVLVGIVGVMAAIVSARSSSDTTVAGVVEIPEVSVPDVSVPAGSGSESGSAGAVDKETTTTSSTSATSTASTSTTSTSTSTTVAGGNTTTGIGGLIGGDGGSTDNPDYENYDFDVNDTSNVIEIDIPSEWDDRVIESGIVFASNDLTGLFGNYSSSGLSIITFPLAGFFDPAVGLDGLPEEGCSLVERIDYDDGVYAGLADIHTGCGPDGLAAVVHVVAAPEALDAYVQVSVQMVEPRDFGAVLTILNSFFVNPANFPS